MTQIQEQKINKYIHFRDYYSRNPLKTDIPASKKIYFKRFLDHLELILKIKDMIDQNKKSMENYSYLREETIQFTLFISRKVTSYALLEELIDIQGLLSFSYDYLTNEPDYKLVEHCKSLLQFIKTCETELSDYSIDSTMIISYRDLIDRFQLLVENKRLNAEMDKDHVNHFLDLLTKTDEIFENELNVLNEAISVNSNK